MKSLTRRQLLFEVFTKDTMKSVAGAYKEFSKASNEKEILNCDEAALKLGKKAKKYFKNIDQKLRKEG